MSCCPCFQRLVVAVLDTSIKEWSMKEVVLMLNIFGLFTDQLEQQSSEVSMRWVFRQSRVVMVVRCLYVHSSVLCLNGSILYVRRRL